MTTRRGFAAMDEAARREVASRGGRAAHTAGTAHEWTIEEARLAGRRGGQRTQEKHRREKEDSHRRHPSR